MYQTFPMTVHPPRKRFEYFQSLVDEFFCPMLLQPRIPSWDAFSGKVEVTDLGRMKLANVSTSACRVQRRAQDVGQIRDARYLIKFQARGESLWVQRNCSVRLRPGDFVVCSTAEPYSLEFLDAYEMPVLSIGADTMRRLTPDPEQFLGIRFGGEEADCGLLSSFINQVTARMSRLRQPVIGCVEANIIDLLGAVLTSRARQRIVSPAQQVAQIKTYIAEHLADRRLSPATIATTFLVSTRHVHSLFEAEPMTIGRYIRNLRVVACRRELKADRTQSLTELALKWGFYDLSHMTRAFREEIGAAPSELRALLSAPSAET
jgi:hypothetical protein